MESIIKYKLVNELLNVVKMEIIQYCYIISYTNYKEFKYYFSTNLVFNINYCIVVSNFDIHFVKYPFKNKVNS